MNWKNEFTDLLGSEYPIMQGALAGIGTWEFAANVSKTGAEGCFTAAVSKNPEQFRKDLEALKEEVDHFTVNISIGMCPDIEEMLEICIEEGIPTLETSAYKPDEYMEYIEKLQRKGTTWIHKGATTEFVKHAEKLGADAGIIVGLEGYGFKNINQLPTLTAISRASKNLNIPFAAAGGIGDPNTFLGALGLGADGIYMGTAFLITEECPLSEKIKHNIIKANSNHFALKEELIAPPDPEAYREVMEARGEKPLEEWIPSLEKVLLSHEDYEDVGPTWEEAEELRDEDADAGSLSGDMPRGPYSFACGHLDSIMTSQELVDSIVEGAEERLRDWKEKFEL